MVLFFFVPRFCPLLCFWCNCYVQWRFMGIYLKFAVRVEPRYAPSWLLQLFEGDQCRVPRQDRVVLLSLFSNQSASSHHCSTVSVIWDSDNVEEEFSFIITPFWLRHLWFDLNDANNLNDFITPNYQYLTVATSFMIRFERYERFKRFYQCKLSCISL